MKENPRAIRVADFKERLDRAKVAVIAEYKGLTVSDLESFRRDLRANGAQMRIIKNTLAKRALADAELPECDDILKGQIAFIFGYEDAVGGPRTAKGFAKKHDEFKVIAGIFEGERVGADIIDELASIPNKETLKAKLLMLMQGPQRKFLDLLEAVPRELVGSLESLAKKKEESGPEPDEAKD